MPPSLLGARRRLETQMTDRILATRPNSNTVRNPISKETGRDQNPPDPDTIYHGKALVLYKSATGTSTPDGGEDVYRDYVRVRVPLTAGPFHVGDLIDIEACGDRQMIGKQLTIDTVPYSTVAVSRILRCTIRTRGPRT